MINQVNLAKVFKARFIFILTTILSPSHTLVDEEFQCHPMSVLFDSNDFHELFWATLSGEYVRETLCYVPIPDNMTETKVQLKNSKFELSIRLGFPHSVVDSNARVIITDGKKEYEPDVHFRPDCFLSGHPVYGPGIASVSYCNGWRGVITTNGSDYQFEPPHPNCNNGLTLVGKRNSSFLMEQVLKKETAKRNNYPEYKMEVGLIYDELMYEYLEKEVQAVTLERKLNFLIVQWNAVQYEFNKKMQLENSIQIVIKYINFFKRNPIWYRIEDQLSNAMTDVCDWASSVGLNFDHIHVGTGWKTGYLVGVGGSGGICHSSNRCAVTKTREWGVQNPICHEIAHGIDIPHDNHPNCNDTPGPTGLMGDLETGWSKCSVKYFKQWLERGRGKCLTRENMKFPQKLRQNSVFNVDTFGSGLLPAMYRSRDQYCEQRFGNGFRYISLYPAKTCGIQSCAILEPGPQFGAIRVDNEGIDGLYCGQGKVCRLDLRCEDLTVTNLWAPIPIQLGGWSAWSPYSECSRSCGLGYKYSRRYCDNPRPINSNWCNGHGVRIQVCNRQPCENEIDDIAIHLKERAAETCTMLVNEKFIDGNKFFKTGNTYSSIYGSLKYFSYYPYRSIRGFDNMGRLHKVSPEDCATECFRRPECRSFEYKKSHRICDLSKETTTNHLLVNNKHWEFFEMAVDEISFFQRSSFQVIDSNDDLPRLLNVSLLSCASACLRDQFCRSFEYNSHSSICQRSRATSQKYNKRRNHFWDLYEITDDVSGKEGLCEVQCDPIKQMDEGVLGHVGFMPDGTSCGSTIDSHWRCLLGKCQKLQTRTYEEFP